MIPLPPNYFRLDSGHEFDGVAVEEGPVGKNDLKTSYNAAFENNNKNIHSVENTRILDMSGTHFLRCWH